ncbi:MAG: ribonuclease III [Prevotellaceae bacterium]|nr:ribonuclease III [Candidatus Minthosoma caballi]
MISSLLDRIRLLFVTEKKPFLELKAILGFYPKNILLYRQALMHKSLAYYEREKLREEGKKNPKVSSVNNERLEFLGDAVLGAIVADILYKHYGRKQEGFLTSLRSKIVCRRSLNKLAVDLGLDKLILYSGAVTSGHNSYMNGNAFEAFFGAIYLDRGYDYCYKFMKEVVFVKHIDIEEVAKVEENFKSALIEWCQKYKFHFEFSQREMRDSHHKSTPMFKSEVKVEGVPCGTGMGYSKKESDQNAAQQALKKLKTNTDLLNGVKSAAKLRTNTQMVPEKND